LAQNLKTNQEHPSLAEEQSLKFSILKQILVVNPEYKRA